MVIQDPARQGLPEFSLTDGSTGLKMYLVTRCEASQLWSRPHNIHINDKPEVPNISEMNVWVSRSVFLRSVGVTLELF